MPTNTRVIAPARPVLSSELYTELYEIPTWMSHRSSPIGISKMELLISDPKPDPL